VVPLSTMSNHARGLPRTALGHGNSYLLGIVGVGLLASACGASADNGKGSESGGDIASLVGNPAPEFSVKALGGGASGTVSLKSLRGKVVLVDFWGTFCEPCKRSFPKLQDLNSRYGASGLRIVGISEDEAEDKDKIPVFASSYGAKFTLGWDEDRAIAKSYKPDTMPSSFVIDKKGVVRYAHVGFHDGDEAEIEKEVKDLLGQ
jgi:cytochrome c biogenesis protein CcmG, thiol:disulfide interchange protein DsbE